MFCDKPRNLATLRVCPLLPGYGFASVSQPIKLRASCDMKLTVVLFGYRTSVSLLSTLIAAQVILKKNALNTLQVLHCPPPPCHKFASPVIRLIV